jgi:hypothetical protein
METIVFIVLTILPTATISVEITQNTPIPQIKASAGITYEVRQETCDGIPCTVVYF